MNKNKRAKLEKKGWKVGSPDEFLGLSPEESAYIELKIALGEFMQQKRKEKHLTQTQIAELVHSGQSRVAKMEKAEKSVSVDLMIRSLFAMGTTTKELSKVLNHRSWHDSIFYLGVEKRVQNRNAPDSAISDSVSRFRFEMLNEEE